MATSIQAGLTPRRVTLDNGAVVVAKETRKTPAVALHLAVRAGIDLRSARRCRVRCFCCRGSSIAAPRRGRPIEIADELDSRGISLTIAVNRHQLSAQCTCLAEDFEDVLSLVGDILMAPSVPDAELATRKGEVITAIRQDQDNPAVRAVEALMAILYGADHPYGRPQKGTIESVEALSAARLRALHQQRFAPSELTAVIVGDVDTAQAVDAAERIFGGWRAAQPGAVLVPAPPAADSRRRLVIPMMNKAQADIAYGFVAISRTDPGYYAAG